jgi:hypothetical protein
MSDPADNQAKEQNEVVNTGLDSLGGLAGVAVGLALSGPEGALLGGAVGPFVPLILRRAAVEFKQRVLGRREERRVTTVIELIARKIEQNVSMGLQIRQDGFFETNVDDRSAADEVLEGVLLVAQREHEERKLPFYSNLLTNIAFRLDVDRYMANALIKQAERMSYRQLCLLSLMAQKDIFLKVPNVGFTFGEWPATQISLAADAYDLGQQGLLSMDINGGYTININVFGTLSMGDLLFQLMELGDIDKVDLETLANLMVHSSPSTG